MDFQNNYTDFLTSRQNPSKEDLAQKERRELQEAINKSKTTAEEENQKRDFDRQAVQIQQSFYGKSRESTCFLDVENSPVEDKPTKQMSKLTKTPVTKIEKFLSLQRDVYITFQDCIEVPGKLLNIVHHTPVFNLPVTINPEYRDCKILERAQILYNYYSKVDVSKRKLSRKSLIFAPLPKLIYPSNKYRSLLSKSSVEDDNASLDELVLDPLPPLHNAATELYVSRAGRHIKRKIYTEDTGDSDEFAISSKKNKPDDSDLKLTLESPLVFEEKYNEEISSTRIAAKPRRDSPRRLLSLSTRKHSSGSSTRCETMFDKLFEDEEKKKQEEKEREKFEKTLAPFDYTEDDTWCDGDDNPVKEVPDDDHVARKRVVPPIPERKGARPKNITKEDTEKIEGSAIESPPDSPVLKRYGSTSRTTENKPRPKLKAQKSKESLEEPLTSVSKFQKTPCPICGKLFIQSEIMNHASSCNEFNEEPQPSAGTSGSAKRNTMTCHLCEKEFPTDTYEVHVNNCIATKIIDL